MTSHFVVDIGILVPKPLLGIVLQEFSSTLALLSSQNLDICHFLFPTHPFVVYFVFFVFL